MSVSWDIATVERVTSTQDSLKNKHDLQHGSVLHALSQEQGRGRHNRSWLCEKGNLAFSFALEVPRSNTAYVGVLSLACGLAVYRAAEAWGVDADVLMLKWPNDVLVEGRKLAGILIEREGDFLIVGIGVNIKSAPLTDAAAICDYCTGDAVDPTTFMRSVLGHFKTLYAQWNAGDYAALLAQWSTAAHERGAALSVKIGTQIESGCFHGLDEFGNLLLSQEENQVKRITAGDVSIGV